MVTKNDTESGSARIMWKPHTFTKNNVRVTASPAVHRTTCSSYLTYLYLYVKGKKKDWEKIKLPFKNKQYSTAACTNIKKSKNYFICHDFPELIR